MGKDYLYSTNSTCNVNKFSASALMEPKVSFVVCDNVLAQGVVMCSLVYKGPSLSVLHQRTSSKSKITHQAPRKNEYSSSKSNFASFFQQICL